MQGERRKKVFMARSRKSSRVLRLPVSESKHTWPKVSLKKKKEVTAEGAAWKKADRRLGESPGEVIG